MRRDVAKTPYLCTRELTLLQIMKRLLPLMLLALAGAASAQTNYDFSRLRTEALDRGVVAFRTSADSVCVQWRYLMQDALDTEFVVYRDGKAVAEVPARHATMITLAQPQGEAALYQVAPKGEKPKKQKGFAVAAGAPVGYLNIDLQQPESFAGADGREVTYNANDASVADLDGDGQMEIVLKWDPSNSRDNSQSGITGNTYIDAYKLDGTLLWRIDLGRNIRSGAHYTQFMVYDFDGDGRAEVIMKTGDGTVDGRGKVIGDAEADYRVGMEQKGEGEYNAQRFPREQFRPDQRQQRGGFIKGAPEYLTVFEGKTGKALCTVDYVPQQGPLEGWGDNYANRSERYLACVAFLDGERPSAVMCRGYYTRSVLAAWDWDGKRLKQRWVFDTNDEGKQSYAGQGNHNLRVGDVDGDGCDEITYGSMCVDHDGTPLYNTGFGHGDAMHLTAFRPLDDALQVWDVHENHRDGSELRNAKTGEVLFQILSTDDVGRCMAADIIAENPGVEMWSSASNTTNASTDIFKGARGIRNYKGELIDSTANISMNFGIWWDGDLLRELLDRETVTKYNWQTHSMDALLHLDDCEFNNGTKSNPALCADILGDWREEIVSRTKDNKHLRIYISAEPTPYRFHTFLQDPVYRASVTAQNTAYNQPTNVGFYFGAELRGSGRLFRGWQF